MYVDACVECFRTRVRLPPPPPVYALSKTKSGDCRVVDRRSKTGWARTLKKYCSKLRLGTSVYTFIWDYPNKFYTGFTENLQNRLKDHNSGKNPHTVKNKPWRTKTAVAFIDRDRAVEFEKYLKSASGRAFAKKHLWILTIQIQGKPKIFSDIWCPIISIKPWWWNSWLKIWRTVQGRQRERKGKIGDIGCRNGSVGYRQVTMQSFNNFSGEKIIRLKSPW